MEIYEIKIQQDKKVSDLLTSCGVFFAFSNAQFDENKTPKTEGEKYVRLFGGGFVPHSKLDGYLDGMDEIRKWFKMETNKTKSSRYALISYELSNHEAYYTGEIEDTLIALGKGYTAKEVWKVFNKEQQLVNARN